RAGWAFQILPFVEGDNVWRGGQATNDLDRARVAVGTPNKVFFCPARRGPQTVTFAEPGYLGGIETAHALCDYAASNLEETGVVRSMFPTRFSDITDGTSQTLLVSEKRINRSLLGQHQDGDAIGYTAGFDSDTVRYTDQPPAPDFRSDEEDAEEE